jgi:hypothetical protein
MTRRTRIQDDTDQRIDDKSPTVGGQSYPVETSTRSRRRPIGGDSYLNLTPV